MLQLQAHNILRPQTILKIPTEDVGGRGGEIILGYVSLEAYLVNMFRCWWRSWRRLTQLPVPIRQGTIRTNKFLHPLHLIWCEAHARRVKPVLKNRSRMKSKDTFCFPNAVSRHKKSKFCPCYPWTWAKDTTICKMRQVGFTVWFGYWK